MTKPTIKSLMKNGRPVTDHDFMTQSKRYNFLFDGYDFEISNLNQLIGDGPTKMATVEIRKFGFKAIFELNQMFFEEEDGLKYAIHQFTTAMNRTPKPGTKTANQ